MVDLLLLRNLTTTTKNRYAVSEPYAVNKGDIVSVAGSQALYSVINLSRGLDNDAIDIIRSQNKIYTANQMFSGGVSVAPKEADGDAGT